MSGAAAPPRRRRGGEVKARLPRIGLALAGGGPLGGIYEIGALLALSESLDGLEIDDRLSDTRRSIGGATDPRPLPTPRRGVRQATRDLAHTLAHLEAWLAAGSAT